MRQLGAHFGQPQLPRSKLVARRTTEFFKALRLLTLCGRTLLLGHLYDHGHRGEHVDAPFEALRPLPALRGKPKLTVLPDGVTVLAAVRVEDVVGQLFLA